MLLVNGMGGFDGAGCGLALPWRRRMKSLTWSEPTELTRGIRLGGMIQIRAEWLAEVEAAFAGQKTMQEALDTAAARGNEQLARFAQTYAGKSFP
jgi:sn-glycerol 3-phosphate transport system substrate-binding protein